MLPLSISSGVLALLLLLIIFHNELRRLKVKQDRLEGVKTRSRFIDAELELNFIDRFIKPGLKRMSERINQRNKSRQKAKSPKQTNQSQLERSLRLAGLRLMTTEYNLIRIVTVTALTLMGLFSAALVSQDPAIQLLVVLFGLAAGVAAPTLVLRSMVNSRQEKISNQMPSIMDILSVSIEAGLGFDAAIMKVIESYEGPLIDEMTLMHREIQMGKPRREAMNGMAARSTVSELQTFVTAVVQADQFGTPIKNVLRSQAIQLRTSRRQQAQEKGMKAPVRMVIPMILFIFPVIFIVLLGPTVISAIEQFG